MLDQRPGQITFRVSGKGATKAFSNEPGGHRWQRVSPTEKRGRVHTSTITIAVLPEKDLKNFSLKEEDLKWSFARGSGKGGQHKNKTDTCVRLTHLPTKISVRIDGRSQSSNKEEALKILTARVSLEQRKAAYQAREKERKSQVGSGQRGDKVRTIRVQDGIVTNHLTNKKTSFKKYRAGNFSDLF